MQPRLSLILLLFNTWANNPHVLVSSAGISWDVTQCCNPPPPPPKKKWLLKIKPHSFVKTSQLQLWFHFQEPSSTTILTFETFFQSENVFYFYIISWEM